MELHIRGVSKTYSSGVEALKDVTLTIPVGMYGLLGPNGAGKSTLMRILATLQEPDEGSIRLGDLDVLNEKDEVRKTHGSLLNSFFSRYFISQSPFYQMNLQPLHVAIIMDGNGRWATARGLPRTAGHRAGASAVRRTVEAAARLGIGTLTLYAFSSDNWQRPPGEVRTLMQLFGRLLHTEAARCADNGIRMSFIGRRDRLEPNLRRTIEAAEGVTAGGRRMHLRLAIDYSARDAIVEAARRVAASCTFDREAFARALGEPHGVAPDVDLLVRTGGEQRLSDFLLWECAYAELLFIDVRWPDFGAAHLEAALQAFNHRERRFGSVPLVPESSTGLS